MEKTELLSRSDLFGGLDQEAMGLIAAFAETLEFERGHVFLEQGRPADSLYVLGEGAVSIRTHMPGHGELLVESVSRTGDVFGWSALVEPYVSRFTARAQESGTALRLGGENTLAFLESHPEAGFVVYRQLASTIAHRLYETRSSLMTVLSKGTISQG